MEENLDETKKKKIVFIAGGLGTAPVYPQVKWLKGAWGRCRCHHGI